MNRAYLASSMMASVGYDPSTRILEIEFTTGAVYHYLDVPLELYNDLLEAPSHGRFFHSRIRRTFTHHRITKFSAQ